VNVKRGLLRLWIVISICWVAAVVIKFYEREIIPRQVAAQQAACAEARRANPKLGNPFDCFDGSNTFADLVPVKSGSL
jgi:hypothetical protein